MATLPNMCNKSHDVIFFYNNVNKTIEKDWKTRDRLILGLGLLIALIIVLANLMVIVAIFLNRRFHYPIYYLLGNMAAADLFAGLAYANLILNTGPWTAKLSKSKWYIRGALIDISLTASVANLLAVAVERHQSVITMRLHSTMSRRRVVLLIISIWVAAIVMGVVPLFWNCECNLQDCSTVAPLYSRHFLIFWAVLNLLTFCIMLVMYSHIFFHVKCHSLHMSQHNAEVHQTIYNLFKTISMVLGAFVICWTPSLITLLVDGILGSAGKAQTYEKYCLGIAECNSLVNPIIYSLRDVEMWGTFKRILCCLCKKGAGQQMVPLKEIDSPIKKQTPGTFTDHLLSESQVTNT